MFMGVNSKGAHAQSLSAVSCLWAGTRPPPSLRLFCSSELVREGLQSHHSGCNLGVTMEEVDLRSQHVGEACSPFVDVVMATAAAEQFGTRCPARHLERGRNGRDGVCLWNDEKEGDADGAGASHGSTPGEAEQRPRGHAVMPLSASFGVMSFSPNGPSGVAPMDRSPGLP